MNRIKIEREVDGFKFLAVATYDKDRDEWTCRIADITGKRPGNFKGKWLRDERVATEAYLELIDMIDCAWSDRRSEEAFNAGPYSAAQCA